MKCNKCNTEVSIANSKCPQCGKDLLQFGSTVFYEPKEREGPKYGQTIKDMVVQELSKDLKEGLEGLDPWERKILLPIEKRLKTLFTRHLSDSEIENVFESEIVPTVDGLSKDKAAEKIFRKVEDEIRNNLGFGFFDHYKRKGEDVLKVLRAGEITNVLLRDNQKDVDLSVKMFPFFKASELACWVHIQARYHDLKNNTFIRDIAEWIGNNMESVYIHGIPGWLSKKKKTLAEMLYGILNGKENSLSGSMRTGISIYVFGREWTLKIERKDLSKTRAFMIKNILKAKGKDGDKERLCVNLLELQELRNERVHKGIEEDEETVQRSRALSYDCLRTIPEILEI